MKSIKMIYQKNFFPIYRGFPVIPKFDGLVNLTYLINKFQDIKYEKFNFITFVYYKYS